MRVSKAILVLPRRGGLNPIGVPAYDSANGSKENLAESQPRP